MEEKLNKPLSTKEILLKFVITQRIMEDGILMRARGIVPDYWNGDNLLAMAMLSPSRHSAPPCRADELPTQNSNASYICYKAEKYNKTDEFT